MPQAASQKATVSMENEFSIGVWQNEHEARVVWTPTTATRYDDQVLQFIITFKIKVFYLYIFFFLKAAFAVGFLPLPAGRSLAFADSCHTLYTQNGSNGHTGAAGDKTGYGYWHKFWLT